MLIEFCSFNTDKKFVSISLLLQEVHVLKKTILSFLLHPNFIPFSVTLHASKDMHAFSQLTHTCVYENVTGGGMQTWFGLAWLGWDALPLPLQPPPPRELWRIR